MHEQSGTAVGQQRDRVAQLQAGGDGHKVADRGESELGVATGTAGGGHHNGAAQGGVDVRPDRDDHPADTVAGGARQRWPVLGGGPTAAADLGLDEDHARELHGYQDLAGAWHGVGDMADFEDLGSSELKHHHCAHGGVLGYGLHFNRIDSLRMVRTL